LSRESIGHTSVAYNKTGNGKHLERSNSKMVSSEAALPILPYIALKARKKRAFTLLKEYLREPFLRYGDMLAAIFYCYSTLNKSSLLEVNFFEFLAVPYKARSRIRGYSTVEILIS